MRICPKCSHENVADVDFCENCNAYLRWDPTRFVRAVPAAPATETGPPAPPSEPEPPKAAPTPTATVSVVLPTPPAAPTYAAVPSVTTSEVPGVEAASVVVSLRLPDAEHVAGDGVTATAEAGGQAALIVLVRNQSSVVDNYDVEVSGVPREWWTATPPTMYLVPFGSKGAAYEDEAVIRFHPPRTEEAEARSWPIEVAARSRAQDEIVGSAPATLVIAPYEQLESDLRPVSAAGRRKASYALMVRNRANAPMLTQVTAADADGLCRFEFESPSFVAEPGRRAGTRFTVRPIKPIWIGRTTDRRFDVVARVADADVAAVPHHAVFRQRAWIPWWVAVLAPILAATAVLVLMLIPKKTTVPNVLGRRPADAQVLLDKAGLKLSPAAPIEKVAAAPGGTIVAVIPPVGSKVKRGTTVEVQLAEPKVPTLIGRTQDQARLLLQDEGLKLSSAPPENKISSKPAGTIIGQVPGAGKRVKTGAEVSVQIAVASGKRHVPNVVGLTPEEAEKAIRSKGLTMAPLQLPPGVDPAKARVSTQIPSAGEIVDATEPVVVFVPPLRESKPATVPSTSGLSTAAAGALLAKLGVVVTEVRRFDKAKPGTVIGQVPPKGTKLGPGQKVVLIVSAGFPEIVYSDGRDLRLIGGFAGTTIKKLTATSDIEYEPTWQPNGNLIAYRRSPSGDPAKGRIWTVDPARPKSARPLTAGPDDRRPAFSPNGKLIAYIHRSGGSDMDLCFARVGGGSAGSSCIVDPAVSVDRPTWAPDGSAILVIASQPSARQTEVLEYTTARPYSTRPSDWVSQGLVTDSMHGTRPREGVLYAAWSPDGQKVALVANWGASDLGFFHVFLAPVSQGAISRPRSIVPQIRACDVSWRSDSAEVVVTQADDCFRGLGAIVRVDPRRSANQIALRPLGGRDPVWQFISLQRR
jgi:beta-lactam-binding protein with PASTA domain